ncbi:MAG: hypothetical protein Kow0063_20620 [Anaerolineae bacterium]
MESNVKLTVRLPAALHQRLRRRAREGNLSLNQAIIQAVKRGLDSEAPDETLSERERVLRVLEASGLYEPLGPGWHKFVGDEPVLSHQELRQQIGKLSPPLSETVIEDRGPR